jgi:aryl-alcohol dehydrogenase-like predicted oxidoreductase
MHFGEALDDERLVRLLRPDAAIHTVVTADAYGAGEADLVVGRALAGLPRESYSLVGAVGHDIYGTTRDGSKGFPRFTAAELRGEHEYAGYLRHAAERSLERCGVDHFDVLLLHNPDRVGYTSPAVWEAMAGLREAGLCMEIGVAPGPANGFTLDVIGCLERFGHLIDWAMLILNPLEPWPGRLALPACERHGVSVLARVVDYGGLFHDDVPDEDALGDTDHRRYRAGGWVEAGRARLDELRPIADRHALTLLQLSAAWTLAQPAVACVAPTLIQEAGAHAKAVEAKRAELAAVPSGPVLSESELAAIAAIGDNTGCMALKGASPRHEGEERPDAWLLDDELREVGRRFGIEADRDLVAH